MTAPVFVDTNVFVYFRDATEPDKQARAAAWLEQLWRERTGRLSYQVLQEYYVTVTRKLKPGLSENRARQDVGALEAWHPVPTDGAIFEAAWQLQDEASFSWWDALIVAAAQSCGARTLLSEDMQHGREIGPLKIVNPFEVRPT
jgi:predicted nucleic acid-binding protein